MSSSRWAPGTIIVICERLKQGCQVELDKVEGVSSRVVSSCLWTGIDHARFTLSLSHLDHRKCPVQDYAINLKDSSHIKPHIQSEMLHTMYLCKVP